MIAVSNQNIQTKIEALHKLGQEHVFRFWDRLNEAERAELLDQINKLDITELEELLDLHSGKEKLLIDSFELAPTEVITLQMRRDRDIKALKVGEKALKNGEVAAFLVAGGQGTRLGFDGPKGLFPITPVKGKSLFQLFAEKLIYLNRKYNTSVPWYIMTSESNQDDTILFFEQNKYFGLSKDHVHFFNQDMLPAFDKNGKLLLEERHRLFLSPNGHGGSLQALHKSGSLEGMQHAGLKHIFYFQVDNVLVNMCDPVFLGYHILDQSDMSTKVVRKPYPEDRIGVICKINGRDGVVEYSDLSNEDMYARTSDGQLKYWAGNIAIHTLSVEFLLELVKEGKHLPYHRAEKKIPFMNESGKKVAPDKINGIKYETFIFDLLLDVQKSTTLEVERDSEFSPVKNSEGTDSPHTARVDLNKNYSKWLVEAGITLDVEMEKGIEISPLFAQSAQDILQNKSEIPLITDGTYIS